MFEVDKGSADWDIHQECQMMTVSVVVSRSVFVEGAAIFGSLADTTIANDGG